MYGVLTKVLSNHLNVSVWTQTTLLMLGCVVWALALAPVTGGLSFAIAPSAWWLVVVAILTSALGNVLYFKGIVSLQSGATQITFSSVVIWGAALSWWFLGSRFSVVQLVGIALLLAAIILAQYQRRTVRLGSGVWLILGSAVCFAGFQVVSAGVSHHVSTATYLLLTYLGDAVVIGVPCLAIIARDIVRNRRRLGPLWRTLIFTSAASTFYNAFAYLAYRAAPDAGLVVVLLTSQVIVGVVLGIVLLHEREQVKLKIAAAALAVVAAGFIKAG